MSPLSERRFLKMNGLGNDFVIVETRSAAFEPSADEVRAIASRDGGIGCDQLIAIDPPDRPGVNATMRIWNADGGEVSACGNASRCVGWLLMESAGLQSAQIATKAGVISASRAGAQDVSVDMGEPRLAWDQIPLSEEMDTRNIELQVGPIDDPVLSLALHHDSGVFVAGPDTGLADVQLGRIEADCHVDYTIDSLTLLPGPFHLGVAVHDRHKMHAFDVRDQAFPLKVRQGAGDEGRGLIDLGGRFTF